MPMSVATVGRFSAEDGAAVPASRVPEAALSRLPLVVSGERNRVPKLPAAIE